MPFRLRSIGLLSALVWAFAAHGAPRVDTIAQGLDEPWALAFLPDGQMLVTERVGTMRLVSAQGKVGAPVAGVPAVQHSGQGGLLDVVLDPKFAQNRRIFWSYSEGGPDGARTAVARGTLNVDGGTGKLADVQVIFRQQPAVADSRNHYGSRLVFAPDGTLFVTLGERFTRKDDAQKLDSHLGKIVRIDTDGRAPADNPFVKTPGAKPEIWSYGHRNVQGAAIEPGTNQLWATEHGPQGGDELNRVQAGRNHGWPVITYGRNYGTGTKIGDGTERADVVAPLRHWVPTSIAPSGLAFLTSDRYPGWKGNLFLGALRGQALWRVELKDGQVVRDEALLTDLGARIRDVRQGPDGWLYLLTDGSEGKLLRLVP